MRKHKVAIIGSGNTGSCARSTIGTDRDALDRSRVPKQHIEKARKLGMNMSGDEFANRTKLMEVRRVLCPGHRQRRRLEMDGYRAGSKLNDRLLRLETERGVHARPKPSLGFASSLVSAQKDMIVDGTHHPAERRAH